MSVHLAQPVPCAASPGIPRAAAQSAAVEHWWGHPRAAATTSSWPHPPARCMSVLTHMREEVQEQHTAAARRAPRRMSRRCSSPGRQRHGRRAIPAIPAPPARQAHSDSRLAMLCSPCFRGFLLFSEGRDRKASTNLDDLLVHGCTRTDTQRHRPPVPRRTEIPSWERSYPCLEPTMVASNRMSAVTI